MYHEKQMRDVKHFLGIESVCECKILSLSTASWTEYRHKVLAELSIMEVCEGWGTLTPLVLGKPEGLRPVHYR